MLLCYLVNYLIWRNVDMKTINVTFENEEIEKLEKKKQNKSWHDFIMELTK